MGSTAGRTAVPAACRATDSTGAGNNRCRAPVQPQAADRPRRSERLQALPPGKAAAGQRSLRSSDQVETCRSSSSYVIPTRSSKQRADEIFLTSQDKLCRIRTMRKLGLIMTFVLGCSSSYDGLFPVDQNDGAAPDGRSNSAADLPKLNGGASGGGAAAGDSGAGGGGNASGGAGGRMTEVDAGADYAPPASAWKPSGDVTCDPSWDAVGRACPSGKECLLVGDLKAGNFATYCTTKWEGGAGSKEMCLPEVDWSCAPGFTCWDSTCGRSCRCVDGPGTCGPEGLCGVPDSKSSAGVRFCEVGDLGMKGGIGNCWRHKP